MRTYEKILIYIEALLTIFYAFLFLAGSKNIADDIAVLFGSLLTLFLIPYFIAYLISKFSKAKDKKLVLWKAFIKIYPIILILTIIGALTK